MLLSEHAVSKVGETFEVRKDARKMLQNKTNFNWKEKKLIRIHEKMKTSNFFYIGALNREIWSMRKESSF